MSDDKIDYRIVYATGKVFHVTGVLKIMPGPYPKHPHVKTPMIDQGEPEPIVALDARARIWNGDVLVWTGCSTKQLIAAQRDGKR